MGKEEWSAESSGNAGRNERREGKDDKEKNESGGPLLTLDRILASVSVGQSRAGVSGSFPGEEAEKME